MIPLIVGILVLEILYFFYIAKVQKYKVDDIGGEIILPSLFFGIIGIIVGIIISALISSQFDHEESFRTRLPIVSLKDNSTISGSFFLGSGTFGEKSYYIMYAKTESGSIFQTKKPVNNSYIVEESALVNKGYIERIVYEKPCKPNWCIADPSYEFYIHVPKGTVIREFNL